MRVRELIRRGDPAIWFTGTGLAVSLLMITGMIGLILVNGLGFFWPRPLTRATLKDGTVLLGELVAREAIPAPGTPEHLKAHRVQFKLGNRDLLGADFRWVNEAEIAEQTRPREAMYVERGGYGPFLGTPVKLLDGERDTPARLRSFLGPLSSDFIGLTGDPRATSDIAARFAAVFFREPAAKDGSYNVQHSTQVFAVDKAGRVRASFNEASLEDMATIAKLLLAEPG